MREDNEIDVTQFIDDCGINRFNLRVATIGFFVVLVEGYDITALAYALPGFMKTWNVASAATLGPLLTASIVGMLVGSPFFGYLGDRIGRRWSMIIACVLFGMFTALVVIARSVDEVCFYRLIAGLGLGGAAPNAIALVSEYSPSRRKGTIVTIMFSGIGLGGALPGVVSWIAAERFGWEGLFWIGAVIALAAGLACFLWLPESVKFLVVRGRRAEAIKILHRISPSHMPALTTNLVVAHEPTVRGWGGTELFKNGYGSLTTLFWIVIFSVFMTVVGLQSWTPAVLRQAGLPLHQATLAQSMFQLGGVVGGICLGRLLDRWGALSMAIFFAVSVLTTLGIGPMATSGSTLLYSVEFCSGFLILGAGYGLGAFAGILYPTSIRAVGSGWALGVGRVGNIAGAMLGGQLIAAGFSAATLFAFAAVPLAIGTFACFGLARLYANHAPPTFWGTEIVSPSRI